MEKDSISFIKADLKEYRRVCSRDVEYICLTERGKKVAFQWQGETDDEYFVIRYLAGIINVGIADNEMDAKHDYTPIGFIDDIICTSCIHGDPDLIKYICKFLKWELPERGVDDLSFH